MSCFKILYQNEFFDLDNTITSTTEDAEFPVSNLSLNSRSQVWRSASATTTDRVVIDLGSAKDIDSFAMFFDALNPLPLTTSVTLKLQANATDSWGSPSVDETLTLDTKYKVASHFFSSTQNYRYWAVYVSDATNPNSQVQLDLLYLAEAAALSQVPEIGFTDRIKDQSKARSTAYGHEYWDIYPNRAQRNFSWKAMSESDKILLKDIYTAVGNHDPIVTALDTDENIFTDKDEYLLYCRILGDYSAKQKFISFFDYRLNVREAM